MGPEFTLVRWLVADGQPVHPDQPICEIETSLASVDVPATAAGTLHHLAREGDRLQDPAQLAKIIPNPGPSER